MQTGRLTQIPFILILLLFFCQISCKNKTKPIDPNGSLRFYELYNIDEIGSDLIKANGILKNMLDSNDITTMDKSQKTEFPLTKFFVYDGFVRDHMHQIIPNRNTGKPSYFSEIGGVMARDTTILAKYFRLPEVLAAFPPYTKFVFGTSLYATKQNGDSTGLVGLYALKTMNLPGGAKLKGDHIESINSSYDERGRVSIDIKMDFEGKRIFAKLTKDNIGFPIAIAINDYVCTAPNILGEINNGSCQISGNYSEKTVEDLVSALKNASAADKIHFH